MQRKTRMRWLWISIVVALLTAAAVVPLLVTAGSGQVGFTATLYSDVIRFEADGVASLRVTIYDLSENELWNSGLIMGDFVDWDRMSERGERLANGYYLYFAQGWDSADTPVLNKTGKVVLLPGDQVQLQSAPTASLVDSIGDYRRDDNIQVSPMATIGTLADKGVFGEVGIGTASPVRSLHVYHATKNSILWLQSGDTNASFVLADPGGYAFLEARGGALGLSTASGAARDALFIDTTGNVGIGTTSPNEQLEITGNFRLPPTTTTTGVIYAGANRFIHNYGTNNTFLGEIAGNFSTTGGSNTAVGYEALRVNTSGGANTAVGHNALRNNTSGNHNTAVGEDALQVNQSGQYNTAVGEDALYYNTGWYNTGVGYRSLYASTTSWNTAVGYQALLNNNSGQQNVAIGFNALRDNTTANFNTAVAYQALLNNISGVQNVAVGHQALLNNIASHGNTAIGAGALDNSTGEFNTALGYLAGTSLTSGTDNIYIGNPGQATESSTIRIGSASQSKTFIAGINGVTVSGGTAVYIKANGQLGTTTSSARFKTGIADLGSQSDILHDLRPVTFRYRPELDPVGVTQYGLIAEEVAVVAPDLIITDEKGDPYTVRYEQLVPLLLNELQKNKTEIDKLRAEMEALKLAVDSMRD